MNRCAKGDRPPPIRFAIAVACFLASAAGGQAPAPSAPARITAFGAHPDRYDEVCLDLPSPLIDWRAAAISGLGEDFIRKPDPDSIRKRYISEFGGFSSFVFTIPAPDLVRRTPWLVLYDQGLTEVHPTVLRGEARFGVKDDGVTVTGSEFSGSACTPSMKPAISAAFFLDGERAFAWTTTVGPPVRVIKPGQTGTEREGQFEVTIGGTRYRLTKDYVKDPPQSRLFRRPGATLLLIIWPSDVCIREYSLYEVQASGTLRVVSASAYGCED